jgi:cell division inhibitor SulA/protein ImuA
MNCAGKLHHRNASENRATRCASRILPTGIGVLDDMLPDGGWPRAGVVEVTETADHACAMELFMPALARVTRQGRGLALVAPPYPARKRIFTDTGVNPVRVVQVNPHPGRSALWTVESLLQSADYGVVMAWPGCDTELMDKRLQKAAMLGRVLCVLFRPPCRSMAVSSSNLRIVVDADEDGRALYLLNGRGERLAGAVWECQRS